MFVIAHIEGAIGNHDFHLYALCCFSIKWCIDFNQSITVIDSEEIKFIARYNTINKISGICIKSIEINNTGANFSI